MCTGDFVEVYSEESQECKITHFSYKWDFLLNKAGTKMIWNFGGPLVLWCTYLNWLRCTYFSPAQLGWCVLEGLLNFLHWSRKLLVLGALMTKILSLHDFVVSKLKELCCSRITQTVILLAAIPMCAPWIVYVLNELKLGRQAHTSRVVYDEGLIASWTTGSSASCCPLMQCWCIAPWHGPRWRFHAKPWELLPQLVRLVC
jgi:hypothetical protein